MSKSQSLVNPDNLSAAAETMRALAHPLRMKILGFIDKHGVINVNKIYNTLKLEQSITSQHLRILREAGVVESKRDGKFIFYSIRTKKVAMVVDTINKFLEKE